MKRQTVEQVYIQQQMTKISGVPKQVVQEALETPEQKEAIRLIDSIKQSLQLAQQSIRQLQTSYPTTITLANIEQLLSHSMQQLKQLETIKLSISNGTKVQLKQLEYQIGTASGTLGMIQQAIGQMN